MNKNQHMEDILEKRSLKENPFSVPKGYFETMQQEVMDKISGIPVTEMYAQTQDDEPVTWLTYIKPALALVSVFAIVFGMGYGVMKLTGTSQHDTPDMQLQADSTPAEMILETTGTELTEEEVISIIGNSLDELISQDDTDSIVEIMQSEINGEEIEQYLIDCRITSTALALLE